MASARSASISIAWWWPIFDDRGTSYDDELVRRLYFEMRERARALPGVESASLTVGVPFEGQYALPLEIPGHDSVPGMQRRRAPFVYAVTPDFFRTIGTRIIAGRGLTEVDDVEGAPTVAVVSASMARLVWPAASGGPLGQCFKIVLRSETPDCIRVVGVGEDARRESLTRQELSTRSSAGEPPFAQSGGLTLQHSGRTN